MPTTARLRSWAPLGDEPFEVIGGELVRRADPSAEHGDAQLGLGSLVRAAHHRGGGSGGPGWWILAEVDVELGLNDIVRPDLVGWRRDRTPERPTGAP